MAARPFLALLAAGWLAFAAAPAGAQPVGWAVPGYPGVAVFDMPAVTAQEAATVRRYRSGDIDGAAALLDSLIERYGEVASLHALRAALFAAQNADAEALQALERAAALGFADVARLIAQPPLSRLADDPRVVRLLAAERVAAATPPRRPAPSPPPAVVRDGVLPVTPAHATWDAGVHRIVIPVAFPGGMAALPLYDRTPPEPLAALAARVRAGRAAGNVGDLYDNRDDGHSALPFDPLRPTQLARIAYGPAARAVGLHYGLNQTFLFGGIVFGNSSTAVTQGLWRSQPRLAMTTPRGMADLWRLYAANHLYVFPEHRDHDPESAGGHGDVYPAYAPYTVISQGSSGSDQTALRAIQAILAAFPPKTKALLRSAKLAAPTIQRVLHQSLKGVDGRDGYLSAAAFPTVIPEERIDLQAAIEAAQRLAADAVPPMVAIRMLAETKTKPGVSFFGDGLSERHFDTPGAIARLWRGVEGARQYVVAAGATDPNGRPVKFLWRLLRGDPKLVDITPLKPDGSIMRATVRWHDRAPLPNRPDISGHRVDIAVFADNGVELSAPAILSVAFPSGQDRAYGYRAGAYRVLSVDYRNPAGRYADPAIWPRRDWRDDYDYARDGALKGWTRTRDSGDAARFDAKGALIGAAAAPVQPTYPVERRPDSLETAVVEGAGG